MKPANWDSLSPAEKNRVAMELMRSHRSSVVIGRALKIASEILRKKAHPEPSDADDMEILGTQLFPLGWF